MVKNLPANAKDARDAGLISRSGRSPGGGNGNPLQYSRLENSMDRRAWWATVQSVSSVAKSCPTLRLHGPQHTRLLCPSPTAGACSNSSIESVSPSNHLILCYPLLLLPSILSSIRVFSNKSVLCIRWPKYWSFSISPSNEYSRLFPLGLTGLISLQSKGLSRVFSNATVQKQ